MKEIVLLIVLLNYVVCYDTFVVQTVNGLVEGSVNTSRSGRPFYSFRAIPFAKPPVGELRWRAPVPPDNWTETLDATQLGPICSQRNYLGYVVPPIEGQEDCLYLNVYSPQIDPNNLLPVVINLPNGGYLAGRGTSDLYGPEYILDKDVVLVSPNYRLGIFGFLSTLDDNSPGNYGVKDQVLTMKWIQENIHNFGGDKDQVTLMGHSAGGMSVHYHLLSPSSRGLFHRGISQSGTALNRVFSEITNARVPSVLSTQASLVNCNDSVGDNAALIKCLRGVSAEELLESQDAFKEFSGFQYTQYGLVTEKASDANPEPFLTKPPLEYILAGDFLNIPWVLGHVGGEGQIGAEGVLRRTDTREALNADFENIVSNYIWDLPRSIEDPDGLTKRIEALYLNGKDYVNISDPTSIQGFLDATSDRWLVYAIYQSVMLHSAMGHRPLWYYRFNYRGAYTWGDFFSGTNETLDFNWGVCHSDELIYLFNMGLFPELPPYDKGVSDVLINMWTNFVISGDPSPTLEGYNNTKWNPVNITSIDEMQNENLCYLNVEGSFAETEISLEPTCGIYKDRMVFWARENLTENFPGLDVRD